MHNVYSVNFGRVGVRVCVCVVTVLSISGLAEHPSLLFLCNDSILKTLSHPPTSHIIFWLLFPFFKLFSGEKWRIIGHWPFMSLCDDMPCRLTAQSGLVRFPYLIHTPMTRRVCLRLTRKRERERERERELERESDRYQQTQKYTQQ